MEQDDTNPPVTQSQPKSSGSFMKLLIIAAVVVIIAIIVLVLNSKKTGAPNVNASRTISQEELTRADGKDGRDCWVAVDGNVYDLSKSANWENGEHTTSEGQARCGGDMSSVIDKSPHGRKMLDQLDAVGTLSS